jgi:hypothetical protein
MTLKQYTSLIVLLLITSGCSTLGLGTKQIEVYSKPVQIDIIHPQMPRPIQLTSPKWYVVSEAKITNRCVKQMKLDENGEHIVNEDGTHQTFRPKACDQADKEYPDMPIGYTKFDQFVDTMKERNGGEVVFIATSVGDYEVQSANMQELKRYIKQLGEVVVYYQTVNDKKPATAVVDSKPEENKSKFNPVNFLSKDE